MCRCHRDHVQDQVRFCILHISGVFMTCEGQTDGQAVSLKCCTVRVGERGEEVGEREGSGRYMWRL